MPRVLDPKVVNVNGFLQLLVERFTFKLVAMSFKAESKIGFRDVCTENLIILSGFLNTASK